MAKNNIKNGANKPVIAPSITPTIYKPAPTVKEIVKQSLNKFKLNPVKPESPKKLQDFLDTIPLPANFSMSEKHFATAECSERAEFMNEVVFEVLARCIHKIESMGLKAKVTCTVSTPSEDKKLKRVSTSHAEGRAFDLSSIGFTVDQLRGFLRWGAELFNEWGAISAVNGIKTVVIHHNSGHGYHFHFQFNAQFKCTDLPRDKFEKLT